MYILLLWLSSYINKYTRVAFLWHWELLFVFLVWGFNQIDQWYSSKQIVMLVFILDTFEVYKLHEWVCHNWPFYLFPIFLIVFFWCFRLTVFAFGLFATPAAAICAFIFEVRLQFELKFLIAVCLYHSFHVSLWAID